MARCTFFRQMRSVLDALGNPPREVLLGYRVRILDGSHLHTTERRLDVHPMRRAAAGTSRGGA